MNPPPALPGPLAVIDVPERCGNAPRKAVIRDFTIALYNQDVEAVLAGVSSEVTWRILGQRTLAGHEEVAGWVAGAEAGRDLRISTVITHGTDCGVDGVLTYADGREEAFCHVLFFTGGAKTAKIKEVRSYVIPLT